jgi:hypothetical protein
MAKKSYLAAKIKEGVRNTFAKYRANTINDFTIARRRNGSPLETNNSAP